MIMGLVTSRPSCPRVLAEWNNGYSLAVPWPGGFTDQETPYNTTHLRLNLQRCVNKQLNTQRRAWLAACRSPLGALALWPVALGQVQCSAIGPRWGGIRETPSRWPRVCAALPPAFAGGPLRVVQRAPCLVAVQPQHNTAHAQAFKLPGCASECPPQAY